MITILSHILINMLALPAAMLTFYNQDLRERKTQVRYIIFYIVVNILGLIVSSIIDVEAGLLEWTEIFNRDSSYWYTYSYIFLAILIPTLAVFTVSQLRILVQPRNRRYIVFGVAFLIILFLIWLPLHFGSYPHFEIWGIKRYLGGGSFPKLTREVVTRLSILIPHTAIHILDPHNFSLYNVAHLLSMWMKGILIFAILKKFNVRDGLCVGVTLLAVLYPSYTQAMSLRNITILFSIVIFLSAIYHYLVYLQKPQRFNLFAFFVMMYFSVTYNEYMFLLILAFPLLFLIKDRRLSFKFFYQTAIWYILPACYVIYYYTLSKVSFTYGSSIIVAPEKIPARILGTIENTLGPLFVTDWVKTVSDVSISPVLLVSVLITIALTLFIFFYIKKTSVEPMQKPLPRELFLLSVGFVIVILAAVMFTVFKKEDFLWRVYSTASVGASIMVIGSIFLISKYLFPPKLQFPIYSVVSSIVIAIAFVNSFNQYQHYQGMTRFSPIDRFTTRFESINPDAAWMLLTDQPLEAFDENWFFENTISQYTIAGLDYVAQTDTVRYLYVCSTDNDNCDIRDRWVRFRNLGDGPLINVWHKDIVYFWINDDLSIDLLVELPDLDTRPRNLSVAREHYTPFDHIRLLEE